MKVLLLFIVMNSALFQEEAEGSTEAPDIHDGVQLYEGEESLINEMRQEIETIHDNEDETRNSLDSLPKEFDLNDFLKEFGTVDCGTGKPSEIEDEECHEFFKEKTYSLLGDSKTQQHDLWKHITENVFKPLAIDFKEYSTISELLTHFYTASNKSSLLENQPLNVNYKTFESSILSAFLDINGRLSDVDGNKEAISQLMISILKKCHLYWNTLRTKGQVKKAVDDTKALIQSLAKVHLIRSQILRKVTGVLFDKIRLSFKRFQGAHRMLDVIKTTSPQIIAEKIIMRYVNMCDGIRRGVWSEYTLTREYSFHIDMMVSFLILNFYNGISQSEIERQAHLAVINRIIQNYNQFHFTTKAEGDVKNRVKQFTAILLLKLTHKIHIAIKYHPLTSYAVASQVDQFMNTKLTVKIMIELQNQMVLIPKTCANFLILKECTMQELNKTFNYLNQKYQLKREVQGWQILDYLNGIIRNIFSEANDFVWANFFVYKQYFYQHLFLIICFLSEHFHIASDPAMDRFDEIIGNVISEAYTQLPNANSKLIDIFDLKLYDEVLNLRAKYNSNSPYSKDSLILTQIQNSIHQFIRKFKQKNKIDINFDFLRFLKKIKEAIREWKIKSLQDTILPVRQGILPVNAKELYLNVDHIPKGTQQASEEQTVKKNDSDESDEESEKVRLLERQLVTNFAVNEALHTSGVPDGVQ